MDTARHERIQNLPDQPINPIVWVVYNANMIGLTESTIISIKGQEYFDKHVTVVASEKGKIDIGRDDHVSVYFDPLLHSLIGNGYN